MKIKSITLRNFRQFIDERMDFSTDENKPYSILLGDNSFGKTTFVRAFIWCLFDKMENSYFNNSLLNKEVAEKMQDQESKNVTVIVELEHNKADYQINTTKKYTKNGDGFAEGKTVKTINKSYFEEGKGLVVSEELSSSDNNIKVIAEVNDIISENLVNYFFFDGENNKIDTVSNKKEIGKTVSELLGLESIRQLMDYFHPSNNNTVTRSFEKFYGKDIESDGNLQEVKDDKEKLAEKIEAHKNQVKDLEEQIEINEVEIKNINTNIYESHHYDSIRPRINEIKNEINTQKSEMSKSHENLLSIFTTKRQISLKQSTDQDLNKILSNSKENVPSNKADLKIKQLPLIQALLYKSFDKNNFVAEFEKSIFLSDDALDSINESVVDQLIERGYCICGTKITNNDDVIKHLNSEKAKMEPHNYSAYVSKYIEINQLDYKNESEKINVLIKNNYEKIVKNLRNYENLKLEQKTLESELEQFKPIEQQIAQMNTLSKHNGSNLSNLNNLKITIEEDEQIFNALEKKLQHMAEQNEANKFNLLCKKYCKAIYTKASDEYSQKRKKIVDELRFELQIAFEKMYHGTRKIHLDEEFNVTSTLIDGSQIDASTGTKTVTNFAFISTIIKMMKEKDKKDRINQDEDVFSDNIEREFPLVMDAPFSNMDVEHIKNVCDTLVDYCNQILLIVMEKDFRNVSDKLKEKIGKMYKINKQSETTAKIVEEEF